MKWRFLSLASAAGRFAVPVSAVVRILAEPGARLAELARAGQNGASQRKGCPTRSRRRRRCGRRTFPGQSTPVIANGRLYIMGYQGEGPDLQEGAGLLRCRDGQEALGAALQRFPQRHHLPPLRHLQPGDRSGDRERVHAGHPRHPGRLHRRRQAALAALDDGGVRPADLSQQPHGVAGGGPRPGDHPRHHRQLGRARPGRRPLLCLRQEAPASWSGPRARATGPRTTPFRIRIWAGWTAGGCSTRPPAMAASSASTRAPAIRSGACRCSRPASTPRCWCTTTTR